MLDNLFGRKKSGGSYLGNDIANPHGGEKELG